MALQKPTRPRSGSWAPPSLSMLHKDPRSPTLSARHFRPAMALTSREDQLGLYVRDTPQGSVPSGYPHTISSNHTNNNESTLDMTPRLGATKKKSNSSMATLARLFKKIGKHYGKRAQQTENSNDHGHVRALSDHRDRAFQDDLPIGIALMEPMPDTASTTLSPNDDAAAHDLLAGRTLQTMNRINEEEREVPGNCAHHSCSTTYQVTSWSSVERQATFYSSEDLLDGYDSCIAGEQLSKRLSNTYSGSAGGLIISTLPVEFSADGSDYLSISSEGPITTATTPSRMPSLHMLTPPSSMDGRTMSEDTSVSIAETYALRVWNGDTTVYKDMERIAEWMGDGSPLSTEVLKNYMGLFEFAGLTLDDAFRALCGKLHLRAETQQIDRILEEFAKRYHECNLQSIFGSQDVVHAIAYSLLLLNTDLHSGLHDHKKMTRSAFVQNTMHTICTQLEEANESENGRHRRASTMITTPGSMDLKRSQSYNPNVNTIPRRRSSLATDTLRYPVGSKLWQVDVEALLRYMYNSIRGQYIVQPTIQTTALDKSRAQSKGSPQNTVDQTKYQTLKQSVTSRVKKAARESFFLSSKDLEHDFSFDGIPRRRSVSSNLSYGSKGTHANSVATFLSGAQQLHNPELPSSYTSAAPFYKEGVVMRKHLLEGANQKAKRRGWKECYIVVDRGEVKMFKLGTTDDNRQAMRSSMMMSFDSFQDMASLRHYPSSPISPSTKPGDGQSRTMLFGSLDLKHTLANALPSGYSRQRQHVFAVQHPNGSVFLFDAGSNSQVLEWVSTFNYWAARESKTPLLGGVSNLKYGWEGLHGPDKDEIPTTLQEWKPPVASEVGSTHEEEAQLKVLDAHIKKLNNELEQHLDVKYLLEQRFNGASENVRNRAMTNWENKSHYLLHEIIKYQNYHAAIENSLDLQAKATREAVGSK